MEALQSRPGWYVIGPLIGLIVVGLMATINQRIGVMGGYSNVLERFTGRTSELSWKWWFLAGVFGGSLIWRLLAGQSTVPSGFGWLTRSFDSDAVVIALLFGGGVLIGFGAKVAGGCTSGNGLGGCSLGSVASFSATATFMGTAIAASFLLRAVF
jgi:uncharacterized membrane protein YedE/YeeE